MNKINYIALCDSEECTFERKVVGKAKKKGKVYKRTEPRYMGAKIKQVSPHTIDCPDCGCVLFWTTHEKVVSDQVKLG